MKWRWKHWIPQKKAMIFAAEGGSGKSSILYDLAARETARLAFPFCPKAIGKGTHGTGNGVLYITAEDDAEDTIVPRFKKAGGDIKKFFIVNSDKHHLDLSKEGLASIKKYMKQIKRKYGVKIKMIIFDPVDAYVGEVNTHMASVVKAIYGPVNAFASRNKCSIIGVLHFFKGDPNKVSMKHMISGSASWVNSSRVALVAFEDPETEYRYMGVVKSNNGPTNICIRYKLDRGSDGITKVLYDRSMPTNIQRIANAVFGGKKKDRQKLTAVNLCDAFIENAGGYPILSNRVIAHISGELEISEAVCKGILNNSYTHGYAFPSSDGKRERKVYCYISKIDS